MIFGEEVATLLTRYSFSYFSCAKRRQVSTGRRVADCPRRGPLHSLSAPTNNQQQATPSNCEVFSRISGGPGDGAEIVRFFSRISGGPGDGAQIVRFFPRISVVLHKFL